LVLISFFCHLVLQPEQQQLMFNLKRRWDLELSPKPCGDRHAPSPVAAIKRAQAKWAPPAGAPATGLADSKDPWVSPVDQIKA
jgi:hypothetical protein